MMRFWLLLLVLLGGCVTVGSQIDQSKVSAFEKGKTTRAEVEAALGQPQTVSTSADGKMIAGYVYIKAQARAESFIPIVGAFVGGTDSTTQVFTVTYDNAGIFQGSQSTVSQMGSGMGLASGKYQGAPPQ
jgi:outer membrane protein assembly factor BamE (lipoprotein component of BamABCDE complex)